MAVGTLVPLAEYLHTSYSPDCDFVDGEVLERNAGKKKHSYAQGEIVSWFNSRKRVLVLQAMPEFRMQVAAGRVRIPDVVVSELPLPDEEVLTEAPYLCVEVMSPDDTISAMQDRLDYYLKFGIPNIWVIDPWKYRGWVITEAGWALIAEVMRTMDGRIALPLADVLLP